MTKNNGHLIKSVLAGSIAEELEIEAGDYLLEINGEAVEDVFDYHYMINDEYIEVLIRKINGEEWLLEIDKDYEEDLGIEFEQGLMDDYKSCYNKCIFCFIDQMPKGMRETLYFKDDDSRLSFLQGNYITLTNMKDKDINRIIRYHLCPINISVHTTNPELRCKMLNNRFAGEALKKIDILAENFIEMNGQVVLCKNVNDKDELVRTIKDLSKYLPHMRSVSVVPSGLTKYRDGLYSLEAFNKEDACMVIDTIESFQQGFYEQYGLHFIHASDEWYIMAEREFPEEERYDGYIQLENGVGMMRLLKDEFEEALDKRTSDLKKRKITLATGKLASGLLTYISEKIRDKFPNTDVNVITIRNDFFGETITVSGLITGQDLYKQLKDVDLGDKLLLPGNVLRSGEDVFLDDMHLYELADKLNINIVIPENSGKDLLEAILCEDYENSTYNEANFVYVKCYNNRNKGEQG
ncbi:MAG: DUF512 domain-containing protein [Lachnospiraceae bacterium]|nr:DUF512 domain-containing protein [Lachnospiraceae bacterium]